jgi:hypothetical protein
MNELSLLPVRIIAGIALAAWLGAGVYLFKNSERIFAADPDAPGETSGARHYSRAQAWLVWLLFAKLFAFLAFAL